MKPISIVAKAAIVIACIASFIDVARGAEDVSAAPFGYQWQMTADEIRAKGGDFVRSTTSYDGLYTLTTRNSRAETSNLSHLVLYVDREEGLVRIDWFGPDPCHGICEKDRVEKAYDYNTNILNEKYGESRKAKECFFKCVKLMWKTAGSCVDFP